MHALSVLPNHPDSARLDTLSHVPGDAAGLMLNPLCIGVCGTDAEIIRGDYGWAPPGRERLVLGHECVARVAETANGFQKGELAVPIVRRPDPVPCAACAADEWDMCRNGRYTEHGIKELDGFCAEQIRVRPDFLVWVPPQLATLAVLVEPTSVVAKAWEHIERIGRRAYWAPRRVLVTGAGPVGLLAALLGRQRGLEVTLFDRAADGPKPRLARALGAEYRTGEIGELLAASPPDIVLECTGAPPVVMEVLQHNARAAITCLVGVSASGPALPVDVGALNRAIVLENDVIFGTVNANRRHYEQATQALAQADQDWLQSLITRRVTLDRWPEAFERRADDVKVLLELAA
jgi:threonine dehydrogenase-like Zn-dependent dehydrogenase